MNTIARLLAAIFIISALAFSGVGLLEVKYLPELTQHFSQVCRESFAAFLSDPDHRGAVGITLLTILSLAVGSLSSIASFFRNRRKMNELRGSIRTDLPLKVKSLARQYGILRTDIKIVSSPEPFVYCLGLRRPKIFISSGILGRLSAKELEAVVIHEAHHYHGRHPGLIFITKLLARTLFFIPVVSELSRLLTAVIEINADRAVIFAQESSAHLRQALGKSLRADPLPAMAALRAAPLETRIALLTPPFTYPKLAVSHWSLAFTLSIIAVLGLLLGSAPQARAERSEKGEVCVKDACQVRCGPPQEAIESAFYTPASL